MRTRRMRSDGATSRICLLRRAPLDQPRGRGCMARRM
jgi:hypothetical protein